MIMDLPALVVSLFAAAPHSVPFRNVVLSLVIGNSWKNKENQKSLKSMMIYYYFIFIGDVPFLLVYLLRELLLKNSWHKFNN